MKQSDADAVKWYRKAAEQNHLIAQHYLADCYDRGEGVEKDYTETVRWYRMAAEQNSARAQFHMGVRYHHGMGVAKDYVEAYAWHSLAGKEDEDAAASRDKLERSMAPQQVAEAQKRTKELRAQIEAKLKSGGK